MLVLILHLLVNRSGSLNEIVPTLGIFAFAGLRLFPALQMIYRQVGALKVTKPAVDELFADMMETEANAMAWPQDRPALRLDHQLELDGISYAYPEANRTALRSLDLAIPARSSVGIVGGTGAGKTTLVDIMLGLLWPDEGAHPGRRGAGHPREPARLAEEHRLRAAADLARRRHRRRQHRLRHPDRADRHGRRGARREDRRAARLRPRRAAGRLRDPGGRPRGAALRWPAPAGRHRPRALPRPGRPDPRRGDQCARQPHREGGDGRGAQPRPGRRPSS